MSVNIFNAATQQVKKIAGNSTGVWSGTKAEYELQKHNIADGTIVVFTDDYSSEICSTVEECVASTSPNDIAGASAVAEINGNLAQLGLLTFDTSRLKSMDTIATISDENTTHFICDIPKDGFYRIYMGSGATAVSAMFMDFRINSASGITLYNHFQGLATAQAWFSEASPFFYLKKGMKVYGRAHMNNTSSNTYRTIEYANME